MKQCYKLAMPLIAIVFSGIGCKETEKTVEKDTLLLAANSIAIAVEGGSRVIAVTSTESWEADSSADWIELSSDDKYLIIEASANPGESIRTAQVTVATATKQETLTVKQENNAGASSLKVHYDPAKCLLDSEGAEFTVTVIASADWEVSIGSDCFALEADKQASRFSVTAPANETASQKTATITVSSHGATEKIALTQQTRSENPYYSLVGKWSWSAEKCFFGSGLLGSGTYASLQLAPEKYNSRYKLLNVFITGSGMYVSYLPDRGIVNIPLGSSIGSNSTYMFYICACNISSESVSISFEGALELTPSGNVLNVSGTNSEQYPYVGVVGFNGMNYILFNDVYYLQTEGSTLARATAAVSAASDRGIMQIEPNFSNILRKRGYAVAIPE